MPILPEGKIGIFVGAHIKWSQELTAAVEKFCAKYDTVVLCDHTSNYHGKHHVLFSLITSQDKHNTECNKFDLLIHIGDISGAYPNIQSEAEWRVNPDGEIRDTFHHLNYVFEMEELYFFEQYIKDSGNKVNTPVLTSLNAWKYEYDQIYKMIPELPFSNIWMAKNTAGLLPPNSILHLGILNSLRAWNFFEIPESIEVRCNTGGFGIDGILSTAIGEALGIPNKIVFCIIGDLAFFYDLNSLGNRHISNNIRILLVNNGRGTEFRNYNHPGAQFGEDADAFVAAAEHYGAKSKKLVKHYTTDLGFEYLTASNKEEYQAQLNRFLVPELTNKPMVFEVFTDWQDESNALKKIRNTMIDPDIVKKESMKNTVKSIIGETRYNTLKKLVRKL